VLWNWQQTVSTLLFELKANVYWFSLVRSLCFSFTPQWGGGRVLEAFWQGGFSACAHGYRLATFNSFKTCSRFSQSYYFRCTLPGPTQAWNKFKCNKKHEEVLSAASNDSIGWNFEWNMRWTKLVTKHLPKICVFCRSLLYIARLVLPWMKYFIPGSVVQ